MSKPIKSITIKYGDDTEKVLDKAILFHFENLDVNMAMFNTKLTDVITVEDTLHEIVSSLAFEKSNNMYNKDCDCEDCEEVEE